MVKPSWLIAVLLFLSGGRTLAQSYGLSFNSHDVVQEKRTSLDLSPADSLCFDKKMTLEFDIRLLSNKAVYFGYLVRIINGNQNIDIICSQTQFKVVSGQQLTNIAFNIDSFTLFNTWSRFSLSIDRAAQRLQFSLNGKVVGQCAVQLSANCYRFLWGANDDQRFNTRDIPPMRIRDISLLNGSKEKYHWSLADTTGVTSTDAISSKQAKVKNPVWIKPAHQHWKLEANFKVAGIAGAAYNSAKDQLLINAADSIWTFAPNAQQQPLTAQASKRTNFLTGHQAIYDSFSNQLLDMYMDQRKILRYDTTARQWNSNFNDTLLTEFWHANKFISRVDTSLYFIGGYGQLKYKNGVWRYHFATGKWDSVAINGDPLPPRYLAALGTNRAGDTAYIIGGYGSATGDQLLSPGNYYDLYSFDVRRRRFSKLYSFKPTGPHFAFANSLVMPHGTDQYYGLIFPNGSFDAGLQLVQGSLRDSSLQLLGDVIPYSFYDIRSFADLFYSTRSNKLLAVTFFYSSETEKVKTTEVKIWSIEFPPEAIGAAVVTTTKRSTNYLWWLLALIPLLIWLVSRRKKKVIVEESTPMLTPGPITIPAAPAHSIIQLFGQFHVIDKDGTDITKQFTPLLKELFLLILVYTLRGGSRGISSEALNEILWHDKPVKDAKNNRSVNLAKLKLILERVGNCHINKDSGAWEVYCEDASVWIDYQVFMQLVQERAEPDKPYMLRLLQIVERGPFLQQTEYSWLDDIKSEVGTHVLDRCLNYVETHHTAGDPEFIIEICNTIFLFDRLNEDALRYKCQGLIALKRHAVANDSYLSFTREYKEVYGEDFPRSFNEIIK